MSTDNARPTAQAARKLEMFIDLVAYHATTSASFFLDRDYDSLSGNESKLRTTLRKLVKDTESGAPDSVAFKVWLFLATELGAEGVPASGAAPDSPTRTDQQRRRPPPQPMR